jgi:hypothetical protein
VPALTRRLKELESERAGILAAAPQELVDNVLELHPRAARSYRAKVAQLREALAKGDATAAEAAGMVRRLIKRITFTPGPVHHALTIEGDLAVMLEQEHAENAGTVVLVPPARIERATSRSTI